MKKEAWVIPNIDWKKTTEAEAQFLLNLAKEYNKEILESANILEKKCLASLGGVIALSSGLFSYAIGLGLKGNGVAQMAFIMATVLLVSGIFFLRGISPVRYFFNGNEPKNIASQDQVDQCFEYMLIGEFLSYQSRIDVNNDANDFKGKNLTRGLLVALLTPVFLALFNFLIPLPFF